MNSIRIKTDDGLNLNIFTQLTGNIPKANVLIVHGMAEHGARYEDFATFLNSKGFGVYIPDLRGHGKTAGSIENTGHFVDKNGWNIVLTDLRNVVSIILKKNSDIPLVLFGHSMGSLIARSYFEKYGESIHSLILSGTSYQPKMLIYGGLLICKIQQLFFGIKHRSRLLTKMSFGDFNKKFKNTITEFDWLSSNPEVAAKYIADPYCGFTCTVGFFRDLLHGILSIQSKKHFKIFPKDKAIYIFSGALDPVGNSGKGVKKVFQLYKNSGVSTIEIKFYPAGRHEMLNEVNKEEVFEDVAAIIEANLK